MVFSGTPLPLRCPHGLWMPPGGNFCFLRFWCDVEVEVEQVHDGVEPGLEEDEVAHHLVQVDVMVQREDVGQAQFSEFGDGVTKHEDQNDHRVEI